MDFYVIERAVFANCTQIYRLSDYSFDVTPSVSGTFASVLINDLQIEIDDKGTVLFARGLCPDTSWEFKSLPTPTFTAKGLQVDLHEEIVPGVSYRLNREGRWPIYMDRETGWICIGDSNSCTEGTMFSSGSVAFLECTKMVALWLQPKFVHD